MRQFTDRSPRMHHHRSTKAPHVPASILQLHDEVSVVADEAALSRIIKEGLI